MTHAAVSDGFAVVLGMVAFVAPLALAWFILARAARKDSTRHPPPTAAEHRRVDAMQAYSQGFL